MENTTAKVDQLPDCDLCSNGTEAKYDVNLGMGWGNVCEKHFKQSGCKLGLGRGQELIVEEE